MVGNILQNLLLCSTEESHLERHEGEEMMTEFISSNLQQSSSKSMLYCQVLFYVTKMHY